MNRYSNTIIVLLLFASTNSFAIAKDKLTHDILDSKSFTSDVNLGNVLFRVAPGALDRERLNQYQDSVAFARLWRSQFRPLCQRFSDLYQKMFDALNPNLAVDIEVINRFNDQNLNVNGINKTCQKVLREEDKYTAKDQSAHDRWYRQIKRKLDTQLQTIQRASSSKVTARRTLADRQTHAAQQAFQFMYSMDTELTFYQLMGTNDRLIKKWREQLNQIINTRDQALETKKDVIAQHAALPVRESRSNHLNQIDDSHLVELESKIIKLLKKQNLDATLISIEDSVYSTNSKFVRPLTHGGTLTYNSAEFHFTIGSGEQRKLGYGWLETGLDQDKAHQSVFVLPRLEIFLEK